MCNRLGSSKDWVLLRQSPSPFQADVYLAEGQDCRCLVKDFSRRPWLIRWCVVRPLLRHEHRVMRELVDIDGIPRVFGFLSRDALVMEFVDGRGTMPSHKELDRDDYPPLEVFRQLERIVVAMHGRGVTHGDIRRRNILITAGGPALIDFGTGVRQQGRLQFIRRRVYRMIERIDRRKVLKLRAAYYPDSLCEQDWQRLKEVPWLLRAGQAVRKKVYRRWVKRRTWQARLYRLNAVLPRRFHFQPTHSFYENCDALKEQDQHKEEGD